MPGVEHELDDRGEVLVPEPPALAGEHGPHQGADAAWAEAAHVLAGQAGGSERSRDLGRRAQPIRPVAVRRHDPVSGIAWNAPR